MEEEEENNEKVDETQTKTKKRKSKEAAIYGNYRNWDLKEDPRLMVLKQDWFEGKDCLDIGCNQGLITVSIGCGRAILSKKSICNLQSSAKQQSNGGDMAPSSQMLIGSIICIMLIVATASVA